VQSTWSLRSGSSLANIKWTSCNKEAAIQPSDEACLVIDNIGAANILIGLAQTMVNYMLLLPPRATLETIQELNNPKEDFIDIKDVLWSTAKKLQDIEVIDITESLPTLKRGLEQPRTIAKLMTLK
jgi:hypothetical protein